MSILRASVAGCSGDVEKLCTWIWGSGSLDACSLSLPAMSDYVELGDAALSAAEVVPDVVASGAALVGGGVATTSPKRKY